MVDEGVGSKPQVAAIFDPSQGMGCQSCSVARKRLWTRKAREQHSWR